MTRWLDRGDNFQNLYLKISKRFTEVISILSIYRYILYFNTSLLNLNGNNSDSFLLILLPFGEYIIISTSPDLENSEITWRHAPHGGMGSLWSDTTYTLVISLQLSETALNIATLSAHMESPYEEFSTLTPVKILPSLHITAEATLNLE